MADTTTKMAPVQGYPGGIPWAIHLEAYEVYCKRWGAQPALIDLEGRNCRGGFSTGELDDFIPGWRDRVTEFGRMKTELASLRARLQEVRDIPPWVSYDFKRDELVIHGKRYSSAMFSGRGLGGDPGALLQLVEGAEDQVTLRAWTIRNLDKILAEVDRATVKFPTWPDDPLHAIAILGEEFGELTKDCLQSTYEPHKVTVENVASEAIQTAAMALRFAMSLGRYQPRPSPQHSQGSGE